MQFFSGRTALLGSGGFLVVALAAVMLLGSGTDDGGLRVDQRPLPADGVPESLERLRAGAPPGTPSPTPTAPAGGSNLDEAAPPSQAVIGRVRVGALGIDAPLIEVGFDATGELDVPRDGTSVGWYTISAAPGAAGNVLLGGHFDWAGDLAVFYRLSALSEGDLVEVDAGGQSHTYRVSEAGDLPFDAPLSDILGVRSGSPTLTLFTCGGTFDASRGEYDRRVVVRAVEVDAG
ncbi:MAG: sortase [Dehalococcoidia bacterium]|nr:sortase [Dehalococcoidia bacterium]